MVLILVTADFIKTYGGDAVGVASVHNGGGLRAVGGVLGEGLGDNIGHGTGGKSESGNRETHCDRVDWNGSKKKGSDI
jgi:hypothetical protein